MTSGTTPCWTSSPTARAKPSAPSGVDAPERDFVRAAPLAPQVLRDPRHRRRAVRARLDVVDLGAEQPVEQRVGGRPVGPRAVEHEHALQPHARRHRGHDARRVRLDAADAQQRVGAFGDGRGGDDRDLADLVAAEPERDRIVALDEQARAAAKRGARASRDRGRARAASRDRGPGRPRAARAQPGRASCRVLYTPGLCPHCDDAAPRPRALHRLSRLRRRAPAAARGAAGTRGHGRVDRHLSCRPAPDARGHVRVPHRQRGGHARGRQRPAPGHEPRTRRAAQPRGAVPDVEAPARVLPVVRRSRVAAGVSGARRARRRPHRGPAPVRGARVAAAGGHPGAPAGARARRVGEPACRPGLAGGACSPRPSSPASSS